MPLTDKKLQDEKDKKGKDGKYKDVRYRNAEITGKEYQLSDENALYLLVRAQGTRTWRYEFRLHGKKQKYTYGNYPEITLANARKLHAAARRLVEVGRHPAELLDSYESTRLLCDGHSFEEVEARAEQIKVQAQRGARPTFSDAAMKYKIEHVDRTWKNPDKGFSPVRVHLLPQLGTLALDDIEVSTVRELIYDVREHKGVQAALHAHGWACRVFDFAIEHELCKFNPAQAIKASRVGTKGKRTRYMTAPEIRRYLTGLYQADGYRGYKLALHLLLMLALRKNELCGANWAEFNLDAAEWLIPANRMKSKKEHLVFLPAQAVEMLLELKRLGYGSEWVMPMPTNPSRPMNGNNLDGAHAAAITAGHIQDYVIHDHRHTASTLLREQGHVVEVVETALSHAIPGMAGTYSHAQYKVQRLAMLQSWADFLDRTMNEQTVIAGTFRKIA